MADLLDRLSRRGVLTIVAQDGHYTVTFKALGPWVGGYSTTDKHDLFEHLRLGAKNWHGDSFNLDALLFLCEMESRPANHDIDDLVWRITSRRDSRTCGPPLPSYVRFHGGWRPGQERWLRCSGHAYEYMGGYERDLEVERKDKVERHQAEVRRAAAERRRVKEVLA